MSFALEHRSNTGDRKRRGGAVARRPEYAMGKAFLALRARRLPLAVHVQDQPRFLFNTPINKVVRLIATSSNCWLMDQNRIRQQCPTSEQSC